MTEKLYEKDSLLKECEAKVLSCSHQNEHYEVVLDRTIIFPEGGGQLSDEGSIDNAAVSYAVEKDGEVVHYTDKPLSEGSTVKVLLNWDVRLDHMQQHCGEHILSYAFWKCCGANNIGFHMSKEIVTVDLDKELSEEELNKAELMANQEIWENKPVHVEYLPDTEVAKLVMRKKNTKLRGLLRVVSVENGDVCTCCGTHPKATGMVGLIKIFRVEKHKNGIRVEFGCGRRAFVEAQQRFSSLQAAGHMLSVKLEEVPDAITSLKSELAGLSAQVKEKTTELFKLKLPDALLKAASKTDGSKVVCLTTECDAKGAKVLLQLLTDKEGLIVALVTRNGDKVNYQFAVTPQAQGNCRQYCLKANELYNGRGGGSASFAQGGGLAEADWQDKAEVLKKYIELN